VADDSGVDSMLRFSLERGVDVMKCCQKIKQMQRIHLGSMGRKHDMTQRRDNVDQRRCDTEKEKVRRRCQLGWRESYRAKKQKNHVIYLVATNRL
jgi:hypothetical protein